LIEHENPKRETLAQSTKPVYRKEPENDPKKVMLFSEKDSKPNAINNPTNPPPVPESTVNNQSNTRARRSMVSSDTPKSITRTITSQQHLNSNNNNNINNNVYNNLSPRADIGNMELPPLISPAPPSPSKPCPQRSLPPLPVQLRKGALVELSTNTENSAPLSNRDNSAKTGTVKEEGITPRNGKSLSSMLEVLQKMSELQIHVSGKEKTMETEQVEIRKQVEEMRVSLDTLVTAVTNLTEKLC